MPLGSYRRASRLFVAHIGTGEPGIGRDDLHQAMRRVPRQRYLVNALPNADPFLGSLQPRALLREVGAAALRGFGLLMY